MTTTLRRLVIVALWVVSGAQAEASYVDAKNTAPVAPYSDWSANEMRFDRLPGQ